VPWRISIVGNCTAALCGEHGSMPPLTGPFSLPALRCHSRLAAHPRPLCRWRSSASWLLPSYTSRHGVTASLTFGVCVRMSSRSISFGPILRGRGVQLDQGWNEILYEDYRAPNLHITYLEAVGRRLRHNYGWIFAVQATTYIGKLLVHPAPITSLEELWTRAAIGPISGQLVLLAGVTFHATWITFAILTFRNRRGAGRIRPPKPTKDRLLELARGAGQISSALTK
jgi:Predicted integral membrane protein (DUF2270)